MTAKFPLAPMGVLAPVSAHAGHSAQPPYRRQRKFFGTRVCRVDFTKFPHFLVKIGSIGCVGRGPPKFFSLES